MANKTKTTPKNGKNPRTNTRTPPGNNKTRTTTRQHHTHETKYITITQINARGSKNVMHEIRQYAVEENIDIIAIQEPYTFEDKLTGLGITTKIATDRKTFSNITQAHKIKVAIAITNNDIDIMKLENISNTHFVCTEVNYGKEKLYIVSAYLQHHDRIDEYVQQLEKIVNTLKGKKIIICMDANAKSKLWESKQTDERGESLEQAIDKLGLIILNKPNENTTYSSAHGTSNIDITLTNKQLFNQITHWNIIPNRTTSDHNIIQIEIHIGKHNRKYITKTGNKRFNVAKADWNMFQLKINHMIHKHMEDMGEEAEIDKTVERIENTIIETCKNTIPRKTRHYKSVPWWNKTLTDTRIALGKARRRYQQTRKQPDNEHTKDEYKKLRNKYRKMVRTEKTNSWQKYITEQSNNEIWGITYKKQTNKLKIETVLTNIHREKDGNEYTTTIEETMHELLHKLIPDDDVTQETNWHKAVKKYIERPPETEHTPPFSHEEIARAIKTLAGKKAPGIDLIEPEVLKVTWPYLSASITSLFNRCLTQGNYPTRWKVGNLKVLLKSDKKDGTEPSSYRPITLLPVMGKVLEKIIAGRLHEILHKHPETARTQYGFKPGHSTQDAIVRLQETTKRQPDKYAVGIMFDISGAFDNVWWPSILRNLKKRQCPENLYKLIASYLTNRTTQITNNSSTVIKEVTKGCPQGSIQYKGFDTIAYADDLIVTITGNTKKILETQGNKVTEIVAEWCNKEKLKLSIKKTETILLKGMMDIRRPPTIRIPGHKKGITMKNIVKYLGIHIGTRLNITPHVEEITQKSKNIFSKLARIAKTK